jgi:hypothetical protein
MPARCRLPDRRGSETFSFECDGLSYVASISRFSDGRLGETFITSPKAGSAAGVIASGAAVMASIAMEYGAPIDVLRKVLMRDASGRPSGPLGAELDMVDDVNLARSS